MVELPDRDAHGGREYVPYLLEQMKAQSNGVRLLDVLTVHFYPQGSEFSDDTSTSTQLLRNRSTRSLWDPNYKDESWINDKVMLISRLRGWVSSLYPGTQIGITEYNWGAEKHINGATAQADILGIFGREGLDLANR
ncbi:MAG TPA: glycoside hydrolase family 44 protein [Thermoanaerobaculia bacterium]